MPAQLRVLRRRIRSTRNIAQITKAMEMVATSRISKAQRRVEASRPYADEFTKVLQVASRNAATDHPLLVGREEPKRAGVLLITSDRGLNGGYNANAFREAERLTRELGDAGKEVVRFVIGGKGQSYYRFRRLEVAQAWGGFSEMPDFENAARVADSLTVAFLTGGDDTVSAPSDDDSSSSEDSAGSGRSSVRVPEEAEGIPGVDELHIVYTEFRNMLSQIAVSRQLAPLPDQDQSSDEESGSDSGSDADGDSDAEQSGGEYEFEPEAEELFDALLPRYLRARVFSALLDAAASESAQRRRAMKAATDNANELIDDLTREANQARQAQITQEISEIVGGAQALSGSGE